MEHQKVSLAEGLGNVAYAVAIDEVAALRSRFDILYEFESSNKARCFVARDRKAPQQRIVQLRVFPADEINKESDLLAFLLEAHAAAQLVHPHIAASTKPEQVDDIHFCVSEHPADAETLRSVLDRRGWLEVEESLQIATQIVQALQYAHHSEVWHLKLRPECVWINQHHHVTLTDFGIASKPLRQWAYERRSRECPLNYRSPEQMGEGHPDERSDLYKLGVLIYEMLTDVLPFNAQDEDQLRHKISVKKAPPLHLIRPDVPEDLSAIVAKLILENPADRFQNAALLQSALSQYLDGGRQAITVETADDLQTAEPEKTQSSPETQPARPPLGFAEADESPSRVFDNGDLAPDPDEAGPLEFHEYSALTSEALSQLPFQSQALAYAPSSEALTAPSSPKRQENLWELSAIEGLKRWTFLPFTLMTLGIVLLTVVSVLAFKTDFKNLFHLSSGANQPDHQIAAPGMEKSGLPTSALQASGAVDASAAQQKLEQGSTASAEAYSASSETTRNEASDASGAAKPGLINKPSASPSLTLQVSRLRQQLRQVNESKVRNSKIRKRYSIAKPRPSKSHHRSPKWRFW